MQPEAGVIGPLLAIAFILGTAIFRSLERSGQVPAALTNSVANDPGCVKTPTPVVRLEEFLRIRASEEILMLSRYG